MSSEHPRLAGLELTLAANNADIGGGEVMLLQCAQAAAELGAAITVVGPHAEGGVLAEARERGWPTVDLGESRTDYLRRLRSWDRRRSGLLWAHGLVPALATAGHGDRIIHLHQTPRGSAALAARVALPGAARVLVPSSYLASHVPGSEIMPNWTADYAAPRATGAFEAPVTIGFLGRLSPDKGILELAQALGLIEADRPGTVRLLLAGEPRFTNTVQAGEVADALDACPVPIERAGWLRPADFFARVDIAVIPSRIDESFGLVAAEAMSARVPLVLTPAGALPELVGEGHPWMAAGHSPQAIAGAILNAVDTEQDQRDEVCRRLRSRWETHFSPAAGLVRVDRLLSTVLQARSR